MQENKEKFYNALNFIENNRLYRLEGARAPIISVNVCIASGIKRSY